MTDAPCAKLRTKGMLMPPNPKADRLQPGGSPTASWWCARTLKSTGPDGRHVAPEGCVAGRSCYEAGPEPDERRSG